MPPPPFFCFLVAINSFEGVIYINLRVVKEQLTSDKLGEEIGIADDNYVMVTTPSAKTNNTTNATKGNDDNNKDGVMA